MPLQVDRNEETRRKIRFTTPDSKIEDLFRTDWEQDEKKHVKKEKPPSLSSFLKVELTRQYLLEHDEERFSARREKLYSFMRIPREVERLMAYGLMQCIDSFLYVYTFLPLRVLLAMWALMTRPFSKCFGYHERRERHILNPAEMCDLLKGVIIIISCAFIWLVDINMLYHVIKSQSIIKLYIFYNILEIGDRLFSAFGQDAIDALFWTATEPKGRKREHLGVLPHLLFTIVYVILHSILVVFQATTLNVAINSHNKALLTIMMSNNFVELKGSVFKKFDKNNLFQVSCSDVKERFQLVIILALVVLQTMREYSWKSEQFWILLPDCLAVLIAEMFVDWIKHAFITRFNELQLDVYRDYATSLAYDVAQTRQKRAFSDHSDLVARRMGFIPLPLAVVAIRVLTSVINMKDLSSVFLLILAYFCLISVKILNSILTLGKACDLIEQHKQEKIQSPSFVIKASTTTTATSPLRPAVIEQPTKLSTYTNGFPSVDVITEKLPPDLGAGVIFANSTVDLKNASLNEELLKADGENINIESAMDQGENMTRSFPDINTKQFVEEELVENEGLKRAESEPSLNLCTEESDLPK